MIRLKLTTVLSFGMRPRMPFRSFRSACARATPVCAAGVPTLGSGGALRTLTTLRFGGALTVTYKCTAPSSHTR